MLQLVPWPLTQKPLAAEYSYIDRGLMDSSPVRPKPIIAIQVGAQAVSPAGPPP